METDLRGRSIIITGGSSGVGLATARLLAAQGARVALVGRRSDGCRAAAEAVREAGSEAGGEALPITADIGRPDDARRIVAETVAAFGGVDALVNNAGGGSRTRLLDHSDEQLEAILRAHVYGPFMLTREAYRVMARQGHGHVINVASVAAYWPGKDEISYGTAKAAMVKFTQHLVTEFQEGANGEFAGGRERFHAHVLLPGGIDTPFWDALGVSVSRQGFLEPGHVGQVIREVLRHPAEDRAFFQRRFADGEIDVYAFDRYQDLPYLLALGRRQKKP